MKFWPFPLLRNYSTSETLSDIFVMFAESNDLVIVKEEMHYITVQCGHGELKFWTANRYYAWAQSGKHTGSGNACEWTGIMPSRYAVRKMHQALRGKVICV